MTSSYWFQGGSNAPGPDVGDPIGNSLRFRGAQTLMGTLTESTRPTTWSFWVKRGELGTGNANDNTILDIATTAYFRFKDDTIRAWGGQGGVNSDSSFTLRDPSAWYHFVVQGNNSTSDRMWINGVEVSDNFTGNQSFPSLRWGSTITIGAFNGSDFYLDGYLADFHAIDGQLLEPTAFGRYNREGVWVPVKPDFSMTSGVEKYSTYLSTENDTQNWQTGSDAGGSYGGPQFAFNGDLTSSCASANGNEVVTFDPVPSIPYTSSVEVLVFSSGTPTLVGINGGSTIPANDGNPGDWTEVATGSGEINQLFFQARSGTATRIYGIRVDGEVLTDPFLWSSGIKLQAGQDFNPSYGLANGFDGNLSTFCSVDPTGSDVIFAPDTPIPFTREIAFYHDGNMTNSTWDGNSFTASGDGWFTFSGSGEISAATPITMAAANSYNNFYAIRVDGQILIDGVNSSYGPNGFHLDFADPNDLGADRSGNYNHFTATGFNTDTPPSGDATNSGPFVTNARNASGNNVPNETGEPIYWTVEPSGAELNYWDYSSSVGAYTGMAGLYAYDPHGVNGGWPEVAWAGTTSFNPGHGTVSRATFDFRDYPTVERVRLNVDSKGYIAFVAELVAEDGTIISSTTLESTSGYEWFDLPIPSGNPRTLVIRWPDSGNSADFRCYFRYFEINNELQLQTVVSNPDYDLMLDSPTQNFATGDPLPGYQTNSTFGLKDLILSDGNLKGNASNYSGFIPTSGYLTSGKWAFKFVPETNTTNYIGVVSDHSDWQNCVRPDFPGYSLLLDNSVYTGKAVVYANSSSSSGTNTTIDYGTTQTGTVPVVVLLDVDDQRIRWDIDGVEGAWIDYTQYLPANTPVAFYVSIRGDITFDFGQQQSFTPPEGFKVLQTQNLPEAPISDGGEHFRVLTGPGASILGAAQGQLNADNGTGFQRGLWWIKQRTTGNNQLLDTVRGGDQILYSDGVNGQSSYSTPTENSVAWCWKAGETVETNNDGDTETQVSANQEAGFSIITYTAPGSETTVGHGLSQAPELIISKRYDGTAAWAVYHHDALNSQRGTLNENFAFSSTSIWGNTDPTNTVYTLGAGANDVNTSGENNVAYCWHSVPGYSKVGTYVGNGNANGPVINCGFKPAFIMAKRTDSAGDWMILDAARSTYNPITLSLRPNATNPEETNYPIDILSNGFKLRWAGGDINTNNSIIVYIAFAQHPFGASKLAPATAGFVGPVQYSGVLPGIASSLRFRGDQILQRTSTTDGNRKTWTYSFWLKKSFEAIDGNLLFKNVLTAGGPTEEVRTDLQDHLENSTLVNGKFVTNNSFRDYSAWTHFVYVNDTTQSTASERQIVYINGVRASLKTNNPPNQDAEGATGGASTYVIGGTHLNTNYRWEGYMADVYFIDGQALEPTAFGRLNADNVWVPVEPENLTYGANGFHLVMDPAYQVGDTLRDQSGNGNDFTMNGFETNDFYSTEFDFMKDGPTQNYATANPLNSNAPSISNANLQYLGNSAGDGYLGVIGSQGASSSKFYWETFVDNVGVDGAANSDYTSIIGVTPTLSSSPIPSAAGAYTYRPDGQKQEGTGSDRLQSAYGDTYTTGDIISVALDMDNGAVYFAKNGVWQNSGDPNSGPSKTGAAFTSFVGSYTSVNTGVYGAIGTLNFGQRPFRYTPPVGFSALQTQNLPEAPITNGRDHFQALTYTGNSSTQTITGLEFQPDFVWIKGRTQNYKHMLFDSIRGTDRQLFSNDALAEQTETSFLTSFNSDGFTLGPSNSGDGSTNQNAADYVAWCWKAGGPAVTNNDGSIESQVSANTEAGFSIVSYTGTQTAGQTVGHGLTQAPDLVIYKALDESANWIVGSSALGATEYLVLDASNAVASNSTYIPSRPTDSVLNLGSVSSVNNDQRMIAYCWHSVPGYSAFGSFNGNSSTDGPFIHLGFRPAFFMWKRYDGTGNWEMRDTTRHTTNPDEYTIYANLDYKEAGPDPLQTIDIVSNGVKIRNSQTNMNQGKLVYAAFAENPFSYPVTAR